MFHFIILLIKLSYSIHPFHASFNISPHASLDVADVPDEVQDELTELRNDSTTHDLLQEKNINAILVCHASFTSECCAALVTGTCAICFYLSLRKWFFTSFAN